MLDIFFFLSKYLHFQHNVPFITTASDWMYYSYFCERKVPHHLATSLTLRHINNNLVNKKKIYNAINQMLICYQKNPCPRNLYKGQLLMQNCLSLFTSGNFSNQYSTTNSKLIIQLHKHQTKVTKALIVGIEE